MKKGIHPEYREVVFQDQDADFAFLTRSTIKTSETISWEDGNDYPLVKLDISSASHPFFTILRRQCVKHPDMVAVAKRVLWFFRVLVDALLKNVMR